MKRIAFALYICTVFTVVGLSATSLRTDRIVVATTVRWSERYVSVPRVVVVTAIPSETVSPYPSATRHPIPTVTPIPTATVHPWLQGDTNDDRY